MNGHVYDLLKWSVLSGGNGDVEKINNQDKTITENGTYTADEGYTGLGTVVVNVSSGGEDGDIGAEKYFEAQYAEVSLPNAEAIKARAFDDDDVLTNIYMPKVKSIGQSAFNGCNNLALTSLPNGLTTIEGFAFSSCINLALTSLPNGLVSIGEHAFENCGKIALTSLPSSVTSIKNYAFKGCKNLTLSSLPSGIEVISQNSFDDCEKNNFNLIAEWCYIDRQ